MVDDGYSWRLRADVDRAEGLAPLAERLSRREELLGVVVGGALPPGVELSTDGSALFAYAPSELALDGARATIERELRAAGYGVEVRVSRWDRDLEAWRQVDPPPRDAEQEEGDEVHAAPAGRPATYTFTCRVSRFDRSGFEAAVIDYARSRGIECSVTEQRRLLTRRFTFTVTTSAAKAEELHAYACDMSRQFNGTGPYPASGP